MIIKSWDSECRASKPGLSRPWVSEGMCDNYKLVVGKGGEEVGLLWLLSRSLLLY